jgi:molybdenum cofactor synthesis domain-containing protein
MVRRVRAEDAVGLRLAHDVVQYGPKLKAVLFKRGHVVRTEDVEELKNAGNYHVHVEDEVPEGIHEDDAATRLMRAAAGSNVFHTKPNKGRVDLISKIPGILRVNVEAIKRVNLIKNFVLVTQRDFSGVARGQRVASGKIVPLFIVEHELRRIEEILSEAKPAVEVIPPKLRQIAAIVVGTEICEGRVKDEFLPALERRLSRLGLQVASSTIVPDDVERIKEAILVGCKRGSDLILVCGGMAVDADDVTARAIKTLGAEIVSHGIPVFPGAMLLVGYLGGTPLLGLPACVIPDESTSFDLLLPKILLGERVTKEELADLGHGGFV